MKKIGKVNSLSTSSSQGNNKFAREQRRLKPKEKPRALEFLRMARVAHLATSTKNGRPLAVPICFVFDGKRIYSSIDEKPKRSAPIHLRRVRNIIENPNVSIVVDHYSENWRVLRYVIVNGTAEIIERGSDHRRAVRLLRRKYRQYLRMRIEKRPIVKIEPLRLISWDPRSVEG